MNTVKHQASTRALLLAISLLGSFAGEARAGWRLIQVSTQHTFVRKSDASILPPGGATALAKLQTSGTVTIADGHAYDNTLFHSVHLNVTGFGLYKEVWKWMPTDDPSVEPYAEFKIKATAKGEAKVVSPAGSAMTSGFSEIKVRCGSLYKARVDWAIGQGTSGGVFVGGSASAGGIGTGASSVVGGTGIITGGNPTQPDATDQDEGDVCGHAMYVQTSRAQCSLTVDANGGLGGAGESVANLKASAQAEYRALGNIDCK